MTGGIFSLGGGPVVGSRVPVDADSWVEGFGGELNVQMIASSLLLLSKDRMLRPSEIAGDCKCV